MRSRMALAYGVAMIRRGGLSGIAISTNPGALRLTAHPFQRLPNTWACRYGDPAWKAFLDMFCDRMQSTGFMRERFAAYRQELVAGG